MSTAGTWHFQGGSEISITAIKKNYTVEITPDSSTDAGILQFNCGGGSLLPIHISNVVLVSKPGVGIAVPSAAGSNVSPVTFHCSADRIRWSAPSSQARALLMDLQGRVMMADISERMVSIGNAPAGAYLFVVKNGTGRQVFRFVK